MKSYASKRRVVRVLLLALFFTIPFINIDGLPLLRFDIKNFTIYMAGKEISSNQIFAILLFIFSLTFFFIYFTRVFGRLWCGWFCPQTIFIDFLPKGIVLRSVIGLIFAFLSIIGLMMYAMPPKDVIAYIMSGAHPVWWGIMVAIFIEVVYIGRLFCKTVCPYSMLQSIMFDKDTLRIGYHPERINNCIKCNACVKTCPTGIDIREGLSQKCVSCASCIDACSKVMKEGDKPVIDYYFGRLQFKPFTFAKIIILFVAFAFLVGSVISFNSNKDLEFKAVNVIEVVEKKQYMYEFNIEVNNNQKGDVILNFYAKDGVTVASGETYTLVKGEKALIPVVLESEKKQVKLDINVLIIQGRNERTKVVHIIK